MKAKELYDSLTESQRQDLVTTYTRNNIILCQSALVGKLLNENVSGFSRDEVTNHYETDKEGAAWYLTKDCDVNEVCEYVNNKFNRRCKSSDDVRVFVESCDDDELQDVCDHFKFYELEKPQEIYEWWLITDWLADKLRKHGQPVLANDYGTWWGRTCTGQSFTCDYSLQLICCEIECEIQNASATLKKVGL